eukprot:6461592-Amphidinium_carterae.1
MAWQLYHLLYVDDGLLIASGTEFAFKIMLPLLILEVLEFPIAYGKVRGGTDTTWIGYDLDVMKGTVGISRSKVEWVSRWTAERLLPSCRVREFRQGLGRLAFVSGILRHTRPLLGPLFSWLAAVQDLPSLRPPPVVVLLAR